MAMTLLKSRKKWTRSVRKSKKSAQPCTRANQKTSNRKQVTKKTVRSRKMRSLKKRNEKVTSYLFAVTSHLSVFFVCDSKIVGQRIGTKLFQPKAPAVFFPISLDAQHPESAF